MNRKQTVNHTNNGDAQPYVVEYNDSNKHVPEFGDFKTQYNQ